MPSRAPVRGPVAGDRSSRRRLAANPPERVLHPLTNRRSRVLRAREASTAVSQVRTYTPKASEIEREWFVVDADGLTLGRMSTEVARVLRGKHKATFSPHMDTGDHVVIINADKVVLSANKAEKKNLYRHSGYPGGIKSETYADMLDRVPAEAVRRTVRGMLPKNRLGRQMLSKLKVYAGPNHPTTSFPRAGCPPCW